MIDLLSTIFITPIEFVFNILIKIFGFKLTVLILTGIFFYTCIRLIIKLVRS